MWLKLLLGALIVAFCALIGYFAAEKYRARKRFFAAMSAFNDKYLSELKYARKPLPVFLKENVFQGDFGAAVNEFSLSRKLPAKKSYLSADEQSKVEEYLNMLGRGDAHAQSGYFESRREELSALRDLCEKEAKERGGLYLKLGVIAGLAFVILII